MWEEVIFVVEGSGYDLHWDLKFDCLDAFQWEWAASRSASTGSAAISSMCRRSSIHQHFAGDQGEARLIVISNRIVKAMGFDWLDQLERAPGF